MDNSNNQRRYTFKEIAEHFNSITEGRKGHMFDSAVIDRCARRLTLGEGLIKERVGSHKVCKLNQSAVEAILQNIIANPSSNYRRLAYSDINSILSSMFPEAPATGEVVQEEKIEEQPKGTPVIELQVIGDKEVLMTSSTHVADYFGKEHKHVIESIEKLMNSRSKIRPMFFETSYEDSLGRFQKEYVMNRDGFTLLAMGFTGDKALDFKLEYIEQFNKMEEQIKRSQSSVTIALDKQIEAVIENKIQQIAYNNYTAITKLDKKINEVKGSCDGSFKRVYEEINRSSTAISQLQDSVNSLSEEMVSNSKKQSTLEETYKKKEININEFVKYFMKAIGKPVYWKVSATASAKLNEMIDANTNIEYAKKLINIYVSDYKFNPNICHFLCTGVVWAVAYKYKNGVYPDWFSYDYN